ncbi:MAG: hypothetical protein UY04_C0033G0007 [Parcubacteria group bacterium GW2011_GWA2_47_7]|nr:MAG: hypothetical protein UY04_C0033G0007 [Parcubacteria group bacterium GW2011_GWA2_47_7]
MNNQKFIVGLVVSAIVFGGGGYYFGTKKASAATTSFAGANGAYADRQGGAGAGGVAGARVARTGGGFSGGEVINIDTQSITVKTQDGSSKVVFYSPTTQISMMAAGTITDVSAGKNIMVTGNANPDGSITAESIQLRPEGFARQNNGAPVVQ